MAGELRADVLEELRVGEGELLSCAVVAVGKEISGGEERGVEGVVRVEVEGLSGKVDEGVVELVTEEEAGVVPAVVFGGVRIVEELLEVVVGEVRIANAVVIESESEKGLWVVRVDAFCFFEEGTGEMWLVEVEVGESETGEALWVVWVVLECFAEGVNGEVGLLVTEIELSEVGEEVSGVGVNVPSTEEGVGGEGDVAQILVKLREVEVGLEVVGVGGKGEFEGVDGLLVLVEKVLGVGKGLPGCGVIGVVNEEVLEEAGGIGELACLTGNEEVELEGVVIEGIVVEGELAEADGLVEVAEGIVFLGDIVKERGEWSEVVGGLEEEVNGLLMVAEVAVDESEGVVEFGVVWVLATEFVDDLEGWDVLVLGEKEMSAAELDGRAVRVELFCIFDGLSEREEVVGLEVVVDDDKEVVLVEEAGLALKDGFFKELNEAGGFHD